MLLERMQPVPGLPELAGSVYTGRRRGWRGRTKGELQKISPLRTEKYFLPFCSHMEAVLGFGTQSKMQWQRASQCKEGTVAWVLHSTQVHGAKFPRGYGYTEQGQDDPREVRRWELLPTSIKKQESNVSTWVWWWQPLHPSCREIRSSGLSRAI